MRRHISSLLFSVKNSSYTFLLRNASYYVNKVRTLDWLKNDDEALAAETPRGHFIVFYNQQPLMHRTPNDVFGFTLPLVPHKKLKGLCESLSLPLDGESMALIDLVPTQNHGFEDGETEWVPVVAVALRPPPSNESQTPTNDDIGTKIGEALGGELVDMRLAVVTARSLHEAHRISKSQVLLRWNRVFRFCPKCGDRVVMKMSKAFASCMSCSRQYHPPASPVAICLISDEKRENCLLIRLPRSLKGVFTAVAGFAEPGESLEDTARREIAEEVGMDVSDIRYAGISQSWPFPDGSMMCAYHATASRAQQPEIDHSELEDAGWFSKEEVQGAWDLSKSDPLCSNPNGQRFAYIPPSGTIAHELVRQWLFDAK